MQRPDRTTALARTSSVPVVESFALFLLALLGLLLLIL